MGEIQPECGSLFLPEKSTRVLKMIRSPRTSTLLRIALVDLRRTLLDELGEPIDQPRPMPTSSRLPLAESQPTLDRLAIHSEFARNPLGTFAAVFARDHLSHQIRPQHPPLRTARFGQQRDYLIQSLFNCSPLPLCFRGGSFK